MVWLNIWKQTSSTNSSTRLLKQEMKTYNILPKWEGQPEQQRMGKDHIISACPALSEVGRLKVCS